MSIANNCPMEPDSYLVTGNRAKENKRLPTFETISRKVTEKVFAEEQEITLSYTTEKPKQCYLKLWKARPDSIQIYHNT